MFTKFSFVLNVKVVSFPDDMLLQDSEQMIDLS